MPARQKLSFSDQKINKKQNFRISGQKINTCRNVKYLGVTLDKNLHWNLLLNSHKLKRAADCMQ